MRAPLFPVVEVRDEDESTWHLDRGPHQHTGGRGLLHRVLRLVVLLLPEQLLDLNGGAPGLQHAHRVLGIHGLGRHFGVLRGNHEAEVVADGRAQLREHDSDVVRRTGGVERPRGLGQRRVLERLGTRLEHRGREVLVGFEAQLPRVVDRMVDHGQARGRLDQLDVVMLLQRTQILPELDLGHHRAVGVLDPQAGAVDDDRAHQQAARSAPREDRADQAGHVLVAFAPGSSQVRAVDREVGSAPQQGRGPQRVLLCRMLLLELCALSLLTFECFGLSTVAAHGHGMAEASAEGKPPCAPKRKEDRDGRVLLVFARLTEYLRSGHVFRSCE